MVKQNIKTKINEFFNSLYGIELEIKEFYVDMDNICHGRHDDEFIYINKNINSLDQELAMVHELNHLYQLNGFSVSINNIQQALIEDESLNYFIRKHEIDSRLVELLYVYDQFNEFGLDKLSYRLFYNCSKYEANIIDAIYNMKDCEVKQYLILLMLFII